MTTALARSAAIAPVNALALPALSAAAVSAAALRLLGRTDLDPWEVNTERSYYEEQTLAGKAPESGSGNSAATPQTLPEAATPAVT